MRKKVLMDCLTDAEKLIRLCGYTTNVDIKIEVVDFLVCIVYNVFRGLSK